MTDSPILDPDGDVSELSDDELLRRIARLDGDTYPLATRCRRVLQEESA